MLLEFDIEGLGLFVDASVEILIVVCELFLLIIINPFKDLIFNFCFLFIISFDVCFWVTWFRDELTCFEGQEDVLVVLSEVEAVDGRGEFVLIGELEVVWFVDFEVAIEGSCHETRTFIHDVHTSDCFLVVAGGEEMFGWSYVPETDFGASATHEGQFACEEIDGFDRFFMMEL